MKTQLSKIALVTGANRGIGHEVARQLCKRGFAVFIGSRDFVKGRSACEELCAEGYEAVCIPLDVTDPVSIRQAVGVFSQKADHLDVLINNAGILEDHGEDILCLNAEMLERSLKTNTIGPILVTQDFLPFLQKSPDGGRIINVSSGVASLENMETYAPAYSISKAALNAVTRQLASSLKEHNISVNSVSPGWTRTDMGGESAPRSVETGAASIVWMATETSHAETGGFWQDKKRMPW